MKPEERYWTIQRESEGYTEEKANRFFSFACPVKERIEIKNLISYCIQDNQDASEISFAWRLGEIIGESSDNLGGKAILDTLNLYHLTNTLVFVLRFKKGKITQNKLLKAYTDATKDCLDCLDLIPFVGKDIAEYHADVHDIGRIMKIVEEQNLTLLSKEWTGEDWKLLFRIY